MFSSCCKSRRNNNKVNGRVEFGDLICSDNAARFFEHAEGYLYGDDRAVNFDGALRVIKAAVKYSKNPSLSNELAIKFHDIALNYSDGIGVEKDTKMAFKHFRISAELGLGASQYRIGICYLEGVGVEEDAKKAFLHFQLAAEQGIKEALCDSGYCYATGRGVEKDLKKAFLCFQLSAKSGCSSCLVRVGRYYMNGYGVEKDTVEAIRCFKLATKQGNKDAQHELGHCYLEGDGVEKNVELGLEYIESSGASCKNECCQASALQDQLLTFVKEDKKVVSESETQVITILAKTISKLQIKLEENGNRTLYLSYKRHGKEYRGVMERIFEDNEIPSSVEFSLSVTQLQEALSHFLKIQRVAQKLQNEFINEFTIIKYLFEKSNECTKMKDECAAMKIARTTQEIQREFLSLDYQFNLLSIEKLDEARMLEESIREEIEVIDIVVSDLESKKDAEPKMAENDWNPVKKDKADKQRARKKEVTVNCKAEKTKCDTLSKAKLKEIREIKGQFNEHYKKLLEDESLDNIGGLCNRNEFEKAWELLKDLKKYFEEYRQKCQQLRDTRDAIRSTREHLQKFMEWDLNAEIASKREAKAKRALKEKELAELEALEKGKKEQEIREEAREKAEKAKIFQKKADWKEKQEKTKLLRKEQEKLLESLYQSRKKKEGKGDVRKEANKLPEASGERRRSKVRSRATVDTQAGGISYRLFLESELVRLEQGIWEFTSSSKEKDLSRLKIEQTAMRGALARIFEIARHMNGFTLKQQEEERDADALRHYLFKGPRFQVSLQNKENVEAYIKLNESLMNMAIQLILYIRSEFGIRAVRASAGPGVGGKVVEGFFSVSFDILLEEAKKFSAQFTKKSVPPSFLDLQKIIAESEADLKRSNELKNNDEAIQQLSRISIYGYLGANCRLALRYYKKLLTPETCKRYRKYIKIGGEVRHEACLSLTFLDPEKEKPSVYDSPVLEDTDVVVGGVTTAGVGAAVVAGIEAGALLVAGAGAGAGGGSEVMFPRFELEKGKGGKLLDLAGRGAGAGAGTGAPAVNAVANDRVLGVLGVAHGASIEGSRRLAKMDQGDKHEKRKMLFG